MGPTKRVRKTRRREEFGLLFNKRRDERRVFGTEINEHVFDIQCTESDVLISTSRLTGCIISILLQNI